LKIKITSRTIFCATLAGAILAGEPVALPAQVSLSMVVDLAQRNSTGVRAAEADQRKALAQLSESKDVIIPQVFFDTGLPVFPEVGFTGSPPSIWSATVQSLIFGIPQNRYIAAARLGMQAAAARLKDAREQVALDASTAYIELDTVTRELDAAQQQENFGARLVQIEQERTEAGVDPLSEVLQARLSAAQVRLRRIHLEARERSLAKQLAAFTGLPESSITTEHSSIPEIPKINGEAALRSAAGVESAQLLARSKQLSAKGDQEISYLPQLSFSAQYLRNTTILNNVNFYFANPLPANNFSSGISIQVPIFDMVHRARARESAADALRATVEAEQAARQNDLQIAELSGNIHELDAQAEIASLKQQIAGEQLRSVLSQLELGSGSGAGPGAPPQLTPKAEQLTRIDERQKVQDAMDAEFDLAKARLGLLRALGHMDDWLRELRGSNRNQPWNPAKINQMIK
jgi:outer membrane protein TolC